MVGSSVRWQRLDDPGVHQVISLAEWVAKDWREPVPFPAVEMSAASQERVRARVMAAIRENERGTQ